MEKLISLVITEDLNLKTELFELLKGTEIVHVLTTAEGRERIGTVEYSVILVDWNTLKDPEAELRAMTPRGVEPPILAVVEEGAMESAAAALTAGAFDYITRPLERAVSLSMIHKAAEAGGLLGQTMLLKPVVTGVDENMPPIAMLKFLARDERPLLIRGETGTGFELVARALHFNGPRRDGPFVEVDCRGLPPGLLESELFGFDKGAGAGGMIRKTGHAELAEGGTLFLRGVGALGMAAQLKLVKAVREKSLDLNSDTAIPWNCRLIVASELAMEDLIKSRIIREDLQKLLSQVTVVIPALRERRGDVPALVTHFLDVYRKKHKRGPIVFGETILKKLAENPWHGNIEELKKAIERYVVAGAMPQPAGLPEVDEVIGLTGPSGKKAAPPKPNPLREASRAAERDAIIKTLKDCAGNKRMAAKTLNVSYKTLFNKLHLYNISTKMDFE